jgi:hypothetical protein
VVAAEEEETERGRFVPRKWEKYSCVGGGEGGREEAESGRLTNEEGANTLSRDCTLVVFVEE